VSAARHFIDIADLSETDLRAILDVAHARKAARLGWPKAKPDADAPLAGRALAMIFEKKSTRTRVSFDIAMRQLGGAPLVMSASEMQLGRGETIEDTARVLERMVDAVMIRANRHEDVRAFAAISRAAVINGLTDRSHPCQIIADLQTIEERGGPISGRRIVWLGDGNNVCRSFVEAAGKLDFTFVISGPEAYAFPTDEVVAAQTAGAAVLVEPEPARAVEGADVVVTDTWVSMGDTDEAERKAAFAPYQVTEALLARAKPDVVFLHCLPAHRGEEVSAAVIDGPHSAVFDEAENRIHAQKAVLLWCLNG
jgi:ornithine carbamoyltransferase